MTPHNYNTRQNSLASNENSTPEISELNVESQLFSRFDNLDKEMPNLKDVITKGLQVKKQRLRNKTNNLEKNNLTERKQ